ncbi:MBG domain-containing protein [Sphingobacterium spiritivorum]|uniref:MBG domain-containing protein n=1 Tax=Sphingobacterium spiritivorum TaxID=258 RepID=UPI003DA38D43
MKRPLLLFLFAFYGLTSLAQTTRYVTPSGAGNKNGNSWANASDNLQLMINNSSANDQVWVAKGQYQPSVGNSFAMKNGVKIYGGFPDAANPVLADRNWRVYTSTLRGNGNRVINNGANYLTVTALLDGFTITGGTLTAATDNVYGAGMYNYTSSPTVTNCLFTNNTIINTSGNASSTFGKGAGIANVSNSNSIITNCVFSNNTVFAVGGGMYNENSKPTIRSCVFENNKVTGTSGSHGGGGMGNSGSNQPATISNSLFISNTAIRGPAIFNSSSAANRPQTLINCTIYKNSSSNSVSNQAIFHNNSALTIVNTVVWGNTGTLSVGKQNGSDPVIRYSLLQGNTSAAYGNLNANDAANTPQWLNAASPAGADGFYGTADDGLQMVKTSPTVGKGDNALYESTDNDANNNSLGTDKDLGGNPRLAGTTIDIGAYEDQSIVLQPDAAGIIYVKQNGAGNFNGTSWGNAAPELADALLAAKSNTAIKQIWVAKGTYKPKYRPDNLNGTNTNDRDNTFLMVKDVKLYGGFAGTEADISQRDFSIAGNKTILSGDLGTASDISDNSYHVLISAGDAGTAELNGFTLTGGNANGTGINAITVNQKTIYQANGGGMYNVDSSPTILNCIFNQNTTPQRGGAMFNSNASPIIGNCSFTNNSATNANTAYAGAMYNSLSNPVITNCIFDGNTGARYGGAMFNVGSAPIIVNSIFKNNRATSSFGNGGAVYNQNNSSSKFTNTLFYNNTAVGSGGAFYNDASAPSVTNCTFYGNTVSSNLLNGQSVFTNGNNFALNNSILWVNDSFIADGVLSGSVTGANNFIQQTGGPVSNPVAAYTAAQLFTDAPNGNLTLKANSPAINAGNNALVNTLTDLAGNSRTRDNKVDIGAYEVQSGNTIVSMVPAANGILYVKQGSAGNGSSWANAASELADALLAAKTNTAIKQIWVAKGTYKPLYKAAEVDDNNAPTTDRDKAFVMVKDVKLYGGFAGTETDISQRDFSITTTTTLSGDLGVAEDISDNAYHVLISAGDAGTAELNGFTLTGGNANNGTSIISVNGVLVYRSRGGGIYNDSSSPTLSNVTLSNNTATNSGGGVYNYNSSSTLNNVKLSNNTATFGGAMYNYNSSSTLSSVTLSNNKATNSGGGVYNESSSPILSSVTLSNNTATTNGGAMYNYRSSPTLSSVTLSDNTAAFGGGMFNSTSSPTLSNVTLSNNRATNYGGGGMFNYNSSPRLSSVTLSNNTATSNGGAMYNDSSRPIISQSKFAGNTAADAGGAVYSLNSSVKVNNSSITGNSANWGGAIFKERGGTDTFLNCTIAGNYAGNDGGGINTKTSNTITNLINTIVYGNTKTTNADASDIRNDDGAATINVNYSSYGVVTGKIAGGNNITANPIFTNPTLPTNTNTPNTNGDYSLKPGSPAIGAGDNTLYTSNGGNLTADKDLAGSPRLTGSNIDMGAYEALVQPQTINPIAAITKTYGDAAFEPGATASSGLTVSYLSADNSIAEAYQDASDGNKWKLKIKKAGTVNITASQTGGNGYEPAADVVFSLTVNQKTVTVSIKPDAIFTKVYDASTAGTMQATDLELASGDVLNSDDVQLSLSSATAQYDTKDAGTAKTMMLPITSVVLAGAQAGNYKVANTSDLSTATAAITPKPLTITANNFSKVYDGSAYSGGNGVSYGAFALGEDQTVLSGTLEYGGSSQGAVNTGSYGIVPSGLSSSNYAISYVNGQLSISLNNVNVLTFNAQTAGSTLVKTYGDADINASVIASSGLVATYQSNNPSVATVNASGQVSILKTGIATITASQAGDTNFGSATPIAFQVEVTKKLLTVTANDFSKTYDGIAYSGGNGVSYSGFALGEGPSVLDGALEYGGSAQGAINTGNYSITPSGLTATNYSFDYKSGTLGIVQSGANVITFNSQLSGAIQQLTYGSAGVDASAIASSGLAVNYASSNPAVVSVNTSGQVQILAAGTAIITASQPGDGNHTSAIPVSFTVNVQPKALTITANNFNKVYDGQVYATGNGVVYNGFVHGENEQNLQGSLSYTGTAIGAKNVGSYFIIPGGYTSGNYAITYQDGSLTITKANLTVTADAKTKVYGTADPALTYKVTGMVNNDAATVVTGTLKRATGENVGTYAISNNDLAASNYTITYVGADLTITKANITVTADAKTKIYGSSDPALTYKVIGMVNNDAATVVTGTLKRATGENVGTYTISNNDLAASNYTITYVGANLTITKANLTVTADAKTKVYGTTDPALSYKVTGMVNNDAATVVTGTLKRATGENVGTYAISNNDLAASNYTITYVGADLTITKANLTVTADAKTKVYGTTDPALTYKVTGMVNNDAATVVTGTLKRATGENVGTYAISNNDLAASNYTITYVGADLTITKANLTVTADAKTKVYGSSDPALTYKVTGLVNNDAATVVTGTLKRAAGENVGTYAISNNDLAASNYLITYAGANLTITKATITGITLSDASFTYDAAAKSILISGTLPAGTTVSYTGNNQTAAGTYTVTANIDGGINYTNLSLQAALKINKAKQVITFKEIPAVYRDAGTLSLDISSNSPLPIKIYSDNTLVAEVTGTQEVTVRGVGLALIRAEQSGDANYIAADAVTRELRVRNEDGAKLPVRVHPAVSPNGDGINDYLRIEGIDEYPENKIGIFDANGNLVQELKGYDNHSNRFDGYKESRAVPAGTYFYMLEVKINGKWVYDKGFFVVRY